MNNVKFFNNHENTPLTPLSIGELVDKITILEIKEKNIKDTNKLVNVQTELKTLRIILNKLNVKNKISAEILKLKNINLKLWDIEDDIREEERKSNFGDRFIKLARSVYFTNDERAGIKKVINLKTNSGLIEEKSYQSY